MEKYIESITQVQLLHYGVDDNGNPDYFGKPTLFIRVWREEVDYDESTKMRTFRDIQAILDKFVKQLLPGILPTEKEIADLLFEMDRLNAVEVKDNKGNGIVLYKNWP